MFGWLHRKKQPPQTPVEPTTKKVAAPVDNGNTTSRLHRY
ncbi:hypothetical protein LRHP540_00086 [Lacticaseibacillus rhamnosus]|nr:hypothetical protein LRHP540_00086 [Lacticaseibacillus rhamnosus]